MGWAWERTGVAIPKVELSHVYPIICLQCNYKLPSYPEANRIKDKGISKIFRVYKVRLTGCPVTMNFVKDGETLVRAKADIGRGKSLVVNKYHGKFIFTSSEVKQSTFALKKGIRQCDSPQWRGEEGPFWVESWGMIKFNLLFVFSVDSSSVT